MRITRLTREAHADAAWALAQRLGRFTYADISAQLHISMDRASEIVRDWVRAGAVARFEAPRGRQLVHEIVPGRAPQMTGGPGSVPLNLWTAMRGLKSFTPTDLAAHATTDTVQVGLAAAQAYCQALLRGGYLKVERKASPPQREAIYRLIRNTGPLPPRERRVRAVFDENLGQIVHVEGGAA